MDQKQTAEVLRAASSMAEACFIDVAVFDYQSRAFLPQLPCRFCGVCPHAKAQLCDYETAHTYGSYEAQRWQGQYVYYCPIGLTFLSTAVYEGKHTVYALVSGPIVMGLREDLLLTDEKDAAAFLDLPERSPKAVNALLQVQGRLSSSLSNADSNHEASSGAQPALHNALYFSAGQIGAPYPVEIEQRLQKMMIQGDKTGARDLINQLLGVLFFHTTGDLKHIKERATELIVLFSRASIEGGADAHRIFGQSRDFRQEMDGLETLDELSVYLTSVFYRFVGYVFDFRRFEHSDIIFKAVNYMRENLSERVTLEDLALKVNLSRSYLSTIFKQELGSTFTDYINVMRIEKSKEYLLNTSLSLVEIADLVGYSDQSYFTKKFAKLAGMSPGQYRKKRGG
jgi:Response regulator containing CheY-like receiver domain and AraC-type DNA-binding domain